MIQKHQDGSGNKVGYLFRDGEYLEEFYTRVHKEIVAALEDIRQKYIEEIESL